MSARLRFCMLTTFYPPYNFGGDGIFVQRLSTALAQRGHQVDVIHCRDAYHALSGDLGTAVGPAEHPNIRVHALRSPLGLLSPLGTHLTGSPLLKFRQLTRRLQKGYDVLHFHNISLVGGSGVLTLGRGVKLMTLHEYWLLCPASVLWKFNRKVCKTKACHICSLVYRRPPQIWRHVRSIRKDLTHLDCLLAPSRFIGQIHREQGIYAPIQHLPNFAPWSAGSDGPPRSTVPRSPAKPFFLFVGRLARLKGAQTLIRLFLNYSRARLLIAGDGPQRRSLQQAAGHSNQIEFLGLQGEAQLQQLYRQAVAVIVPSLWYENMPLVILEAYSQGTPVIARHIGALPELIEAGGGYTYTANRELRILMDRLLDSPALGEQLGRAGQQACRQQWSLQMHLERYLALIDRIRSSRHPGIGLERFNGEGQS